MYTLAPGVDVHVDVMIRYVPSRLEFFFAIPKSSRSGQLCSGLGELITYRLVHSVVVRWVCAVTIPADNCGSASLTEN